MAATNDLDAGRLTFFALDAHARAFHFLREGEREEMDRQVNEQAVRPAGFRARFALLLGALTVIGPVGIDIYLPAFPALVDGFAVTPDVLQFSLVSYVVALSLGQAVWGPLADRYGRRSPLVVGLALATGAALGATIAHGAVALVALRFVQGLGACAAVVIARSIARDTGSGPQVARLIAMMAIVQALSPAFAPSVGGLLLAAAGWQSIFLAMAAMAAFGIVLTAALLRESLPAERRQTSLAAAFERYRELGADRAFVLTVFTGGFGSAAFFSFLTGSPQTLMGLGGLNPGAFAIYFSVNAVIMVVMAQVSARLIHRIDPLRWLRGATLASAVCGVFVLLIAVSGIGGIALLIALLPVPLCFMATLQPIIAMRALECYPHAAGAASAVLGIAQYACGAASGTIVGLMPDDSAVPMVAAIAGAAAMAHALTRLSR